MAEKRLELVPDAIIRTYVGEPGWTWVMVRRIGGGRVRLDLVDRVLVDLADGILPVARLRREAERRIGRSLGVRELSERLDELVRRGVLRDGAEGFADLDPAWPANLIRERLTDGVKPKLVVAKGARTGCDGRGGCCRLYDRIDVNVDDIARLKRAFPDEVSLPGGLTVESALRRERDHGGDTFSLAVRDGGCVALEEDGRCGIHARLGFAAKPAGCRTYPLRDVLVGEELHVGLGVECRCVLDFATDGEPIEAAAETVLRRRMETRAVETIAGRVAMTTRDLAARADYLEWRSAAGRRAEEQNDPCAWALDEAARLVGGARPRGEIWRALQPIIEQLQRLFEEEARDTAAVYSRSDLQPKAFAFGAEATARLAAQLDRQGAPGDPQKQERFVVEQALFTHGLLRSRSLATGLVSLALRLAIARSSNEVAIASELLPLSTVEYLFRAQAADAQIDRAAASIDDALG